MRRTWYVEILCDRIASEEDKRKADEDPRPLLIFIIGTKLVTVDPIDYFLSIHAIGEVCAAADRIQPKGGNAYNQVGIGIAKKYRSARVTGASATPTIPISLRLQVETIGECASKIHQGGFCHQPRTE